MERLFDNFLGNPPWRWLVAGAVAFGIFFVLLLLRRLARKQYVRLELRRRRNSWKCRCTFASRTAVLFLLITSIFLGLQTLELPARAARAAITLFTVVGFWQFGLWATTANGRHAGAQATQVAGGGSRRRQLDRPHQLHPALHDLGAGAAADPQHLGIEIQPLLAGLGIGGIAVALAAQNILGDLFASLSITLDRPFVLGDTLQVDDFVGTSNTSASRARVCAARTASRSSCRTRIGRRPRAQLTRATERRVVFTISVGQETPLAELQ